MTRARNIQSTNLSACMLNPFDVHMGRLRGIGIFRTFRSYASSAVSMSVNA